MSLKAEQLVKSFGATTAVKGVSLQVQRGEIVGLLGPNGAGKSTTVGMIYGFVIPDQGRISVDELDIFESGRAARRKLGIVTQDDLPDGDFTVRENLEFFGAFYALNRSEARERSAALIERFLLAEHQHKYPGQLSGGLRRRLVLARALLGRPHYLCLDEPTTGLDPDARQLFWKHIQELKDEGCGVLLTTHYMDEAERLCDRVVLMQHGQTLDSGTPPVLIRRTAGVHILEAEGSELERCEYDRTLIWSRPYGSGVIFGSASTDGLDSELEEGERALEKLFLQLSGHSLKRLTKRSANLEDVFLKVSGDRLA